MIPHLIVDHFSSGCVWGAAGAEFVEGANSTECVSMTASKLAVSLRVLTVFNVQYTKSLTTDDTAAHILQALLWRERSETRRSVGTGHVRWWRIIVPLNGWFSMGQHLYFLFFPFAVRTIHSSFYGKKTSNI